MKTFIPDKQIKESVLFPNLVPSNIEEVLSSDDFMKELQHNESKTTHMQIKEK